MNPNQRVGWERVAWVVCWVGLTVSAAGQEPAAVPPADPAHDEIAAVLKIQTAAWNDGDLERFMSTYWKSPQLTFSSGGNTTRGWQATLDRYRKNYAPPKEMGKLHFDQLETIPIEARSALVLGQWHLTMADDSRRDGNFSLVMKKIDGVWKIIHDHSSLREPDEPAVD